ncbi:MAG: hypothetical protein LBQ30_05440 [Treponema sp.]|jgi:heptaprenyl diphosphate synthase|nr:hypothetical protein [Treponema sp.]
MKAPSASPDWEQELSSGALCVAGLIMMVAFLLNPSILLRTVQFLIFWVYARLRGKRNKPLITLSVMGGIVIFNLFVPYGRVLLELGPFPITQGALLSGLHKAVTLEGLIMLSKASIRSDLRLPGAFGALLGESFRILEGITRRKTRITWKRLIEGIDHLMLELSAEQESWADSSPAIPPGHTVKPRSTLTGFLLLGAACLPILALTFFSLTAHVPY